MSQKVEIENLLKTGPRELRQLYSPENTVNSVVEAPGYI